MPTLGGGYNIIDNQGHYSQIQATFGGGCNILDNQGNFTQINPTFGGGYNITGLPPAWPDAAVLRGELQKAWTRAK